MFALDSTEGRIETMRDNLARVHAVASQLASNGAHLRPHHPLLKELSDLATTTRQHAKDLRG